MVSFETHIERWRVLEHKGYGEVDGVKSVLISIRPEWCAKIASGEKTVEVRRTRPTLEPPFLVCIYCTSVKALPLTLYAKLHAQTGGAIDEWSGKVFASFVCDRIDAIVPTTEPYGIYDVSDDYVLQTCLENGALWDYGHGETLYGWHISKKQVYDEPCELAEAGMKRPPQSWCYVEGGV